MPETKNKSLEVIEKQLRLGTIETPPITPASHTPQGRSRDNSRDTKAPRIFKTESVDVRGDGPSGAWDGMPSPEGDNV